MRLYKSRITAVLILVLSACGGGDNSQPGPMSGTYEGTLKLIRDNCKLGTPSLANTYVVEQYGDSVTMTSSYSPTELFGESYADISIEVESNEKNGACEISLDVYLNNVTEGSADATFRKVMTSGCFIGEYEPMCIEEYGGIVARRP